MRFTAALCTLVLLAASQPRDITIKDVESSRDGKWLIVKGADGGRDVVILAAAHSGRAIRELDPKRWPVPMFTRDSSAIFSPDDAMEVRVVRLTDPVKEIATGIEVGDLFPRLVFSDGARRAAFVRDGTLTVFDIDRGARVASTRLPAGSWGQKLYFVSPSLIRFYAFFGDPFLRTPGTTHEFAAFEFDVASGRFEKTGSRRVVVNHMDWQLSADGSTLVIERGSTADNPLQFADGRTLKLRAQTSGSNIDSFLVMRDGRVAGLFPPKLLRIYRSDGTLEREIDIGECDGGIIKASADRLLAEKSRKDHASTVVVDPSRGVVEREEDGITPAQVDLSEDPRLHNTSFAIEQIAVDSSKRFWTWNPRTGVKRPLVVR